MVLVLLARAFAWRDALRIVQPATLIRWHRRALRLFWRWRSRSRGCPRIPADPGQLIRSMALDNPAWGERRIAAGLLVKLGLRVSPRTVRRYMPAGTGESDAVPPHTAGARSSGSMPPCCWPLTFAWW
jgi:putative transposase